ncbi:Hypothetical protein D9617_1g081770 [Elsinoe fawcettii]|nr:Hypothetical protein D9617_1g081770 [Elsinoe fawcettii]
MPCNSDATRSADSEVPRDGPPSVHPEEPVQIPNRTGISILGVLASPVILGGFLFMSLLPEDSRYSKSEASDETGGEPPPQESRRPAFRPKMTTLLKSHFFTSTSPWIPLATMTFMIFGVFWSIDKSKHRSSASNFDTSCPPEGRRTQTAVFVKLFAATVTTLCIHGHLGSLAGSGSLRRETFRAFEILICPLTPAFTLAVMVWVEVAQLSPFHNKPWGNKLGIRYRLARMCSVRVDADTSHSSSTSPNPYLAGINPEHLTPLYLKRDLKWFGRALILVIILSQYVQAAVLLIRRFISDRSAAVDIAMFLMVISGTVGLLQSLIITFIHTDWKVKEDIESCTVKSCFLPECFMLKQPSERPERFVFKPFGWIDLTGVPRIVLHMLVAGFVQMEIVEDFGRKSIKDIVLLLVFMKVSTEIVVKVLLYAEGAMDLIHIEPAAARSDATTTTTPSSNTRIQNSSADIPESLDAEKARITTAATSSSMTDEDPRSDTREPATPLPATVVDEETSWTTTIFTVLFAFVSFVIGLAAIAFGLLCIAAQLVYIFGPCWSMYSLLVEQTKTWSSWDIKTPCPQLWKDGLEDEMWWF